MVGRGAALDGRLFLGATDGSNLVPSASQSGSGRDSAAEGELGPPPGDHSACADKQCLPPCLPHDPRARPRSVGAPPPEPVTAMSQRLQPRRS